MKGRQKLALGILLALVASPAAVFARHREPDFDSVDNAPQISVEKSGKIPTKQGLFLQLNTDPGNVRIFTDESAQVSYRVVVQADSRDPGAEEFLREFTFGARRIPEGVSLEAQLPWRKFHGQFGVNFEIHIPRRYGVKINTQGGNIEVQNIEGQVDLVTGGGNITIGSVSPQRNTPTRSTSAHAGNFAARLETQGGHITIGDVAGTLRAMTSGGHITAGNIGGDGILRTGGGQIQTGRIAGAATLETGGGNIRVERAGSSVAASTAGGQIVFAEAEGTIRTQTGRGAVHLEHIIAPTVVETSGGGIFLGKIDASLRVSSGEGDMIVYLPRQLAATIDALVVRSSGRGIVVDPALPLRISHQDSGPGPRTIRGEGNLNGGGEVLHLRAASGNIILKLGGPHAQWNTALHATGISGGDPPAIEAWDPDEEAAGFLEEVRQRIQESWWGGVPVDAGEMQSHLLHSVAPTYPDAARIAGVEGEVTLRVYVSSDGRVTDIKVLDGSPILARAAVEAVQQWQYRALKINGKPASVVTTLIVAFRLK